MALALAEVVNDTALVRVIDKFESMKKTRERTICPTCRRVCVVTKSGLIHSHDCDKWLLRQKRGHHSKAEYARWLLKKKNKPVLVLDDAQRELAESHMNWANYWARREWLRLAQAYDIHDFQSAAYLGLVRAAYWFNKKTVSAAPFKMFAQKFIVGNIRRFVTDEMRAYGFARGYRGHGPLIPIIERVPFVVRSGELLIPSGGSMKETA